METEDDMEYSEAILVQNRKKKKAGGFNAFGLDNAVLNGVKKRGYRIPTPIQRKTIPLILLGKDVVAMARTGSGKTAAFLLPMLQRLKRRKAQTGARALLVSPTRELALQTFKFVKELGKYAKLKAAILVGGDSMEEQFAAIHANPDILIATPGRLMHIVIEMSLKMGSIEYVVFDEADRLFELGFEEQLKEVMKRLPVDRQTLLFSATLPKQLLSFAKAGLNQPTLVRLDVDSKISDLLNMTFLLCRSEYRMATLLYLLDRIVEREQQTIVFCATKHHVEYVKEILTASNYACSHLYSAMDPEARKLNVTSFSKRETNILIVTDLAARGVDIPLLDNVINLHFPGKAKLYVHRVGRVARAGRAGRAFSILTHDELPYLLDLGLFLGRNFDMGSTEPPPADTGEDDFRDRLGTVPIDAVSSQQDTISSIVEADYDVQAARTVSENAFKQYLRSRPKASLESIRRLKSTEVDLSRLPVHPVFSPKKPGTSGPTVDGEEDDDAAKASNDLKEDLLKRLKNYKSQLTVFEMNRSNKHDSWCVMKALRRSQKTRASRARYDDQQDRLAGQSAPGPEPTGPPSDSAKLTPASTADFEGFEQVIQSSAFSQKSVQRAIVGRKSKTKDRKQPQPDQAFVPYKPKDYHSEQGLAIDRNSFDALAQDAVLDLTGDDGDTFYRNKERRKWDRKRKKFIVDSGGGEKKIRTESGLLVRSSYKTGRYEKWKKERRVDENSDNEEGGGDQGRGPRRNVPRRFQKQKGCSKTNCNLGFRPKEVILKQRKRKERMQEHQKKRFAQHQAKPHKAGGSRRK